MFWPIMLESSIMASGLLGLQPKLVPRCFGRFGDLGR